MGLTRLAITRPLAILMLIVGLVIMGAVSYSLLRVDRLPNISFPFVSVSVSYPGAPPEDVEQFVAEPIEAAVSGINGVSSISSSISEGRATVSMQLAEGADANQAAIDTERQLNAIRNQLPSDASVPTVNKADPNSQPIMNVALSGQASLTDLYDIAVNDIQPRLQSVLGVANVSVSGGTARQINVQVEIPKLEAYGVTLSQISTVLSRQNVSTPAGTMTQGRQSLNVRAIGQYQSASDLGNVVVGSTTAGPIYLRDVATITDGYADKTTILRLNGSEGVGLSITKQSDANSLQVATDVRSAIQSLQRSLPSDVKLTVTNDTSIFTRQALDAVQTDLTFAIFLTAIVLLLFLHTWRNTLIVILAVPTSLVSTFLVMYILKFSLDTISMMALALTTGILVDDSIVVLENIHRHLHKGEPPMVAALNGRSEIGLAAMAITFTDVVVYLPVAFMQGNLGSLFREYGVTIATATLFSLFVCFTLTPMLASRWIKETEGEGGHGPWARFTRAWESGYGRLEGAYGRLLGWALHHRPVIILIGAVALAVSLSFLPLNLVGSEYTPQEDDSQFNVSISMPPSANLATTDQATRQVEAVLARVPEVQTTFTSIGGGGGGFGGGGTNSSRIAVQLVDKRQRSRSVFDIINDIRRQASSIPEMSIQMTTTSPLVGGGGGGGASVQILGDNLTTLTQIAGEVEQAMRQVPGVVDVRNSANSTQPEVQAVLDRARMSELGLDATTVGSTMRTAISGSTVTQLRTADATQVPVNLSIADVNLATVNDIASIPLTTINGSPIRLGQIATITRGSSPAQISRQNRTRVLSVSAVTSGRSIGDIARDLRQQLGTLAVPAGYQIVLSGQVQQLDTALASFRSALTLSILLIYMLMVALFESWLYPLAIMFALPVSLVGAFTALLITGNTFNIFSLIGMIMLMGLVSKNAILLVDYTNTLRGRGLAVYDAIVESGRTRLRPILMTTATIVFAMIPLALKLEAGAETRSPMAVVVIGGVISSTMLTLVLVPVVYTYFDQLQVYVKGFHWPFWSRRPRPTTPPIGGGSGEQ